MRRRGIWTCIRETQVGFFADDVLTQAAAMAFYTALGLAPTVFLMFLFTGTFGADIRTELLHEIQSLIGGKAAQAFDSVVEYAEQQPPAGWAAWSFNVFMLLVSASGIFAQLQSTLNRIWGVQVRPSAGWWGLIRARLLSVGLLFAVMFLMAMSLGVSAALTVVFPRGEGALWFALSVFISWAVFAAMFGLIFKFLPDVRIAWRDVVIGAMITSLLFIVGKAAIGIYLGNSTIASGYGASGSLIALLVWVYYSAVIVFLGAEITQVVACHYGSGIEPSSIAQKSENG